MPVKRKKAKKEPIGVLAEKDAVVELYWELLRNNPKYREDYKKYEQNPKGKLVWLATKWSLLEPLDPILTYKEIDSEYKAYYFFRLRVLKYLSNQKLFLKHLKS